MKDEKALGSVISSSANESDDEDCYQDVNNEHS